MGGDGKLEPDALVKIARPHRLVESFVAPLASSGGAEESTESMRESAPATVLALSRAVSRMISPIWLRITAWSGRPGLSSGCPTGRRDL